jgi:hypothetical protein
MFAEWILNRLTDGAVVIVFLGSVGFLARTWIKERLSASIRVEADSQLERVRSEIRVAESRITAVTGAGIAAIGHVAQATFPARIDAAKRLWSAAIRWRRGSAVSMIMAALTPEYVRENGAAAKTSPSFRQILETVPNEFLEEQAEAESARPLVSTRAWALYSALHSFYMTRVTKLAMLINVGANAERLWTMNTERTIIESIGVPTLLQKFDQIPLVGAGEFIAYVEKELAAELKTSLAGDESGSEASRQAMRVLQTIDEVRMAQAQPPEIPSSA